MSYLAAGMVLTGAMGIEQYDCSGMKYFCEDFRVIRTGSWKRKSSASRGLGKGFRYSFFMGKLMLGGKSAVWVMPGIGGICL